MNCFGLSRALPVETKALNFPSASLPILKIVTSLQLLQPKSIAGPIFLFGWTPSVGLDASDGAHIPQCQKLTVFSSSSMETGSPKKTAFFESLEAMNIESPPYMSLSQALEIPMSLSIERTAQFGVPNCVKRSGQHLEPMTLTLLAVQNSR